jgi:hypothetical protein
MQSLMTALLGRDIWLTGNNLLLHKKYNCVCDDKV